LRKHILVKVIILGIIMAFLGSSIVPAMNGQIDINNKNGNLETIINDYSISYEKAQNMIENENSILLIVQEEMKSHIAGVMTATLEDIECGGCINSKIGNYDSVIIYSEEHDIQQRAVDILRDDGVIVYELSNLPNSITNQISDNQIGEVNSYNRPITENEEYYFIQLMGTDAHVSAYSRGNQIKRLYGEPFSYGESPEASADAFLQSNAWVFNVGYNDLKLENTQPVMYLEESDSFKFTALNYEQYRDDIPVFRSRLVLLVRNEENFPLVLASVDVKSLGDFEPGNPDFLGFDVAIQNVLDFSPTLIEYSEPELVIWAGLNDRVEEPILAYSFIASNGYSSGSSNPEQFLFITDAETGEIIYYENRILEIDVVGNVQGKATQGSKADFCDDEVPVPMPYARVNIGSTVAYADENGDFVIPNAGSDPVDVESRVWGEWFRVFNYGGSDTVLYAYDVIPPGPVNFMHNSLNNDEYIRAEVNGYVQANIVRDFTLTYNPSYPGLQQNAFPVNVNLNDVCNAFYDYSSINFFRSGGGCANSAFSTIIHHEYGHHLVSMAGSGQGQYGEGMGDVMGVLITDDSALAWGFYMDCNGYMRNADNTMQYPCSGEIHYCGTLISGCVWSTRNELAITNPDDYLDIISNLAVNSMLLHTGNMITPSITIDYLTLDDDNGNIYDGTPHYFEIAAGFGAHNMDAPPLALLSFSFPNGLPDIISPDGGTTLRVVVEGIMGEPEPGTGVMYVDTGSGYVGYPMEEIEPNVYDAEFPPAPCPTQVYYYFEAETTEQQIQEWPPGAPDDAYYTVVAANDYTVEFSDDFESDLGWTVENDPYLTDGAWERGVPIGGGGRGDPPTDYDGSGQCYLTDNVDGNSDVDDGITWLISPTMDLTGGTDARISYALWYTNNYGNDPNNDLFKVYISNNGGGDWTLAETIGPVTESGWTVHSFMVGDFVTPTNQVKVRFEASDLNEGSVVEAGIDAVEVISYQCGDPIVPDLDCEGSLSWTDVEPGAIVEGSFTIENVGDPESRLDWDIDVYPEWGTWTFDPENGDDLTPEDGQITVEITVEAPDEQNEEFEGEIKIVNIWNNDDYCTISVSLATPANQQSINSPQLQILNWLRFSFLGSLFNL